MYSFRKICQQKQNKHLILQILIFYLSIFKIFAQNNILWISDELSKGLQQSNLDEWDSSGIFTCQNDKTVSVKSQKNPNNLQISKKYSSLPPHAFALIQVQVFQIDEFSENEGFTIQFDSQISSVLRYSTVSQSNICGDANKIDQIYTERFGVVHTSSNLTLQFNSILSSTYKLLAINNLKVGVIPCEKTCAECKLLTTPSQNLTDLFCMRCPDNAQFTFNTNICTCISDYSPNFDLGYLVCIQKPVQSIPISSKCQQELNDYATRSRIVQETTIQFDTIQQQKYAWTKINTYQFFQVISSECQSFIKFDVYSYNNITLLYQPISRKYIRNQIQGNIFEISFLLSEIPFLANYMYVDASKNFLYCEIYLAMKYIVGTNEIRTHRFKVIYTTNYQDYLATTFNTDYSKNMNFINFDNNALIFLDEFSLELKRYLCSDKTCNYLRTNYGYNYREEVIVRVQFKLIPSERVLKISQCYIYVDNNQFDILSQINIIDQNAGYLTLSFQQMHQYQQATNQQYNQVYLQISVAYLDNKQKLRQAQVTLIYYALKPSRLLSLEEFDSETIDFLHTNPDDLLQLQEQ